MPREQRTHKLIRAEEDITRAAKFAKIKARDSGADDTVITRINRLADAAKKEVRRGARGESGSAMHVEVAVAGFETDLANLLREL